MFIYKASSIYKSANICLIILGFTLLSAQVNSKNFKVIDQSKTQMMIEFKLGEWSLENAIENGQEYQRIKSDNPHNLLIDETETLPFYSTLIAIPDGMNARLKYEIKNNEVINSVKLANNELIKLYCDKNGNYPQDQVLISEPGQFRDFRVVNLNLYPFQFNSETNSLIVINSVTISLEFTAHDAEIDNTQTGYYSPFYNNLYNSMILNYESFRDELIPTEQPKLLIIYPTGTDATFTNKFNEFITWKRQKGYIVNTASTSSLEAGNTSSTIKTYISNAYNNISTRPDVVLLIGDPSSGLVVPTFNDQYGDFPYTLLSGGDEFSDVQIGRISVETNENFSIYVNKVMLYEKNVDIASAQWLNKMFLVGDSHYSGISTYYNNYYIQEISRVVNPDYTYNIMHGDYYTGQQTNFDTAISSGVGFFNYRGYMGMSGWSPNSTTTNNYSKLNHGVFITCDTGTFYSSTSRTESYIRLGTTLSLKGGITAIGMATTGTHTAINSFLCGGIFDGIFNQNMRTMGEALFHSRNYLQTIFGISNPTNAYNFKRYCNLMGDPTVEVFVAIPKTFNVTSPATIASGTPFLEMTVKDNSNIPIANATVNLWQTNNCNMTAYSDASGKVIFAIPSSLSDTLTVTISKHDYKPYIQSLVISGTGLIYYSSIIDDDTSGDSNGNNNQIINAGETIEYKVRIKNNSSSSITSITGTLSCSDPYITLNSGSLSFPTAYAGSTSTSSVAVRFTVSPQCPNIHPVVFHLNGNSSIGAWNMTIQHVIISSDLDYQSHTITGDNNYLDPGETTTLITTITNNGSEPATGVYGVLRSLDSKVTINDSLTYFGDISSGNSVSNSTSPFNLSVHFIAFDGMTIPMELYLYNASGYNDTESFTLTIGNSTVTDPLGQDSYGYFIFDTGDISYEQCPIYDWIGIAPEENGAGTALAISDAGAAGDEGDQIGCDAAETINLPFTFKYYGINYNQITVVSNGYIVFGTTNNHDWRNGRLPGAVGPNAMVAAFWDDLSTMTGGIYTYYNETNHQFIIEWYNLRNGYNRTSEETFQIILYNPNYYPTSTGDGPIKIQYKTFNNVDSSSSNSNHGNYCTIGIKNHTGTDGLEYTYNNTYPIAAQPLSNQKALYITTSAIPPNIPSVWITQTTIVDANNNGLTEPGETIDLILMLSNWGVETAENVSVTISESDPWLYITNDTASWADIIDQGSVSNTSGLTAGVLAGCPNNHIATITATITATGYIWIRTFSILINSPILSLGEITIEDPNPGNNNGKLDPGETANIVINITNTGGAPSANCSATISCQTNGITINSATANFASLNMNDSASLSFNVSASSSMLIGTNVSFLISSIAGNYSVNKTLNIEIGPPTIITIGSGTSTQTYPIDRYYNYSAHESIYLASEIGISCKIKSIALYKASGTDVNVIDSVKIYMKHTSASTITTGTYSTAGYTMVYNGAFTNNAVSGWMEVNLNSVFQFNGTSNLSILIIKGHQQFISSGYAYWTYSSTSSYRARQNRSDTAAPTSLTNSYNLPNLRLKVFPIADLLYPPQNLTATISNQLVKLDWSEPISGGQISYKIYKNNVLLTSTTSLSYTDFAVVNGATYNYFITALYNEGESDSSNIVYATPNAMTPINLICSPGNGIVNLSWTGASGFRNNETVNNSLNSRFINGYNIYRDNNFIINITDTTYIDTSVINETTYSYYVTTVYSNPNGESAPSNQVNATPTNSIFASIGNDSYISANNHVSPINISFKSVHGQSVYTATELNNAGVYGPMVIRQLGFFIITPPALALPSFIIRMKHTTELNATNWQTETGMITVYTNSSYMPVAGGYQMLTLSTPFIWNGIDNIVLDTAFGLVSDWSNTGTLQYSSINNGFRAARIDTADQTNVFVGGNLYNRRANVKFAFSEVDLQNPEVVIQHIAQGIKITWNAIDNAIKYVIYAANTPFGEYTQIAEVNSFEYIDTAHTPNRFYYVVASTEAITR